MHLGRNDKPTYTLFDQITKTNTPLQHTVELGVWTTPAMNFSLHCHKIANKANQILKRNFKYISISSFMIPYKTFVLPHLEYCALIWNPHFAKVIDVLDIDVLEKVQRRATKLIPSISTQPYEARLAKLNLHLLYCRRQRGDLIEVYKILNRHYLTNPQDVFAISSKSITRGHSMKLFKQRAVTTTRLYFFSFRVINHWNKLPQEIISATSQSAF